ncbi:MAG: hypothetical protein JNL49_06910, partial [Bacteroidia bacterium]|nr:hypothetical protein [Bacteroidia bacterium]
EATCGYFHMNSGVYKKPVFLTSTGAATSSSTYGNHFEDSLTITNNGAVYFNMGSSGEDIYDGPVILYNYSSKEIRLAATDTSYFNNHVTVNASSGGVEFGASGGVSILASGKTISVGTFSSSYLTLTKFIQLGSTAQTLTLSGTGVMSLEGCVFNGNLTINAPGILTKTSTYNGNTTFNRTGSATNFHSYGSNVYAGNVTWDNAGSVGRIRLASTAPDTYLADATFSSSGGQDMQVAYVGDNGFSGNITITSNKVVFNTSTGKVTFTGTNNQTLNGSYNYLFKKLAINKASGTVTANTTLSVDDSLIFIQGNLITTSTNLLTMKHGSTANGASNSSCVSGPVKKIGNSSFVFPIGKSGNYRALEITSPTNSSDAFLAEYFSSEQSLGSFDDTTLFFIDNCKYWSLGRTNGSSTVNIKLHYNSSNCGIVDSANSVVLNWHASKWNNIGNGGISGTINSGSIPNASTILSYSYFTIGYTACQLEANAGSDTNLCYGSSIEIGGTPSVTNGTEPINYSWNTSYQLSDSLLSNPTASPTATIKYILSISDSMGCEAIDSIQISILNPLVVEYDFKKPTCNGWNDGWLHFAQEIDSGFMSHLWLPDSVSTDSMLNLTSGLYQLYLVDTNNCEKIIDIVLSQPGEIKNIFQASSSGCSGQNSGSIMAFVSGGSKPYQFDWSHTGSDTCFVNNLSPQMYYLDIIDSLGCTLNDSIEIFSLNSVSSELQITNNEGLIYESQPLHLALIPDTFALVKFYKNNIKLQSKGNNSIQISDFSNGDTIKAEGLLNNGCILESQIILEVLPINDSLLENNGISYCSGSLDTLEIEISSSAPSTDYILSFNGIDIDTTSTGKFTLREPPDNSKTFLIRNIDNSVFATFKTVVSKIYGSAIVIPPICHGEPDASISVNARGGSGIYQYNLNSSGLNSTNSWSSLATGSHTITIQDDMGCNTTLTVTVPEVSLETSVEN